MFCSTALLIGGKAFEKVITSALGLKVGDVNRTDFVDKDIPQFSYGKDNARKMNFFQTPTDALEGADELVVWASSSVGASQYGYAHDAVVLKRQF